MDDVGLTLATLDRLEAERKLRVMPTEFLECGWALEAQREAVIDALLTASTASRPSDYIHARHVGEWSARIAQRTDSALHASFMRRCGVLAEIDPDVLDRLPEVREFAMVVRAYQSIRIGEDMTDGIARTAALIVAVADEFDSLAFEPDIERRCSPNDAIRMMSRCAEEKNRAIVQALMRAVREAPIVPLPTSA